MNKFKQLKKIPVKYNQWVIQQVGTNNDGPYKQMYPNIPVNDSGEELVSASKYGLVSSDFYLNEYLTGKTYLKTAISQGYLRNSAFLRKSHVLRLRRVDIFLRENGVFLHIQSGWRHPKLQIIIKNEFSRINGTDKANRLFATVIDGAAPPPHATGAAFDLELRNLSDGKRQELYYSFEGEDVHSSHELEQLAITFPELNSDKVFTEVLENRRVLFHSLCSINVVFDDKSDLFTSHPGECWHFGDGDPLSAYLNREKYARYGFVELPD